MVDGWMDAWMDGWMDGWMAGWMAGWMDGWQAGTVGVNGEHREGGGFQRSLGIHAPMGH